MYIRNNLASVTYLLCGNAIRNGLLHGLSRNVSHDYIREAIEHLGEKSHQSNLELRV